jgi:phosphoserine phosphatase
MVTYSPLRLVAFDVDGTLLRGRTICECIADGIGRGSEMAAFEQLGAEDDIRRARATMAGWYRQHAPEILLAQLDQAQTAPGLKEGFAALRRANVKIALVSITWHFAVERLAQKWGADFAVGTGLRDDGTIEHFWPVDKAMWLSRLTDDLGLSLASVAAVGDSLGDVPMLAVAGRGYFVGAAAQNLAAHVLHWPDARIDDIAHDLLR